MFSSLVVVNVRPFINGSADRNGLEPKILNVLAGKSPNRTVISGTIADNLGLEDNSAYLMQIRETEPSEQYGRQFSFSVVSHLKGLEIVQTCKELGKPDIFNVDEDDDVVVETTKVSSKKQIIEEIEA